MKIIIIQDKPQEQYGIYGNCVSTKGEADIMKKSQDSVRNRFGYGQDDNSDYSTDGGES